MKALEPDRETDLQQDYVNFGVLHSIHKNWCQSVTKKKEKLMTDPDNNQISSFVLLLNCIIIKCIYMSWWFYLLIKRTLCVCTCSLRQVSTQNLLTHRLLGKCEPKFTGLQSDIFILILCPLQHILKNRKGVVSIKALGFINETWTEHICVQTVQK